MQEKNFKAVANQPPGTLNYTGKNKTKKVTLELIEYNEDKISRRFINNLSELPKTTSTNSWLNVSGMHNTALIKEIGDHFKIHKIDLEGTVNVMERSQIEDKGSYLLSLLKMIYIKRGKVIHEHISIILKKNFIITFQETPGDVFDEVRKRLENKEGQIRSLGADYLYYSLIDNITDRYYKIIKYVSDRFNEAENEIIAENSKETKKVYWLRKELLYLKNVISPLQSELKNLIDSKHELISDSTSPYLDDVLDNVEQIYDEIMTYREITNSLYETQMSNAGNEMNKTMMTLTIFSAIFIPLSFLAGVFGMNFVSVPGLMSPASFIVFCVSCVAIAAIMLFVFKVKKWF
jgi:magnesium transporter